MSCICAICGFRKDITTDFTKWPLIMGKSSEIYPVTKGGKPDKEVKGFICAKCLNEAISMKMYVKSILNEIIITEHAVERFLSRRPADRMSKETAKRAIIKILDHADQIRFKKRFMINRLLNNRVQPTNYYYAEGLIFVLTQESPPTILTIELTMGKKLGRDFFHIERD